MRNYEHSKTRSSPCLSKVPILVPSESPPKLTGSNLSLVAEACTAKLCPAENHINLKHVDKTNLSNVSKVKCNTPKNSLKSWKSSHCYLSDTSDTYQPVAPNCWQSGLWMRWVQVRSSPSNPQNRHSDTVQQKPTESLRKSWTIWVADDEDFWHLRPSFWCATGCVCLSWTNLCKDVLQTSRHMAKLIKDHV